jgi:arsenate reductase (glutaredoxin)
MVTPCADRASVRGMPIQFYHYPKCSTCRKARKWLDEHGVKYADSDLVASPIPLAKLRDLHKRSGQPVTRLFNTSGESYRAGNFKVRSQSMSDSDVLSALAKDGKLVKRPILDTGKSVLIGFDEDAYASQLG